MLSMNDHHRKLYLLRGVGGMAGASAASVGGSLAGNRGVMEDRGCCCRSRDDHRGDSRFPCCPNAPPTGSGPWGLDATGQGPMLELVTAAEVIINT
jgi:hypothetical protein